MQTIVRILTEAGTLESGFHLHIDNPPWMPLDIEEFGISGPNGLPTISVAHYGHENGDAMRDPEMLFEMRREPSGIELFPYYWRNDYLGIEQYSECRDDQQKLFTLAELKRRHEQFARLWDKNLRAQGYYEAFVQSRSRQPADSPSGHTARRRPAHAFNARQPQQEITQ